MKPQFDLDTQATCYDFANADPIQLSPTREPLPWATYSMHPESRFHARTRGAIRDGVLTSEPVDLRIP